MNIIRVAYLSHRDVHFLGITSNAASVDYKEMKISSHHKKRIFTREQEIKCIHVYRC